VLPAHAAPETGPASDPAFGDPVPIRGQLPVALPFFEMPPASAFLLPKGAIRLDTGLAYENTHALSRDLLRTYSDGRRHFLTESDLVAVAAASKGETAFLVDGETLRLALGFAWGLGARLELDAELPLLLHTGGFFDGTIENYHDALGFGDGGRGAFERNQSFAAYSDPDGTLYVEGGRQGIRPGDLSLVLRGSLYRSRSGTAAVSGSLGLELPTGDPDRIDGNGRVDENLGVEASWRYRRSSLHIGARLGLYGGWDALPDLDLGHRRTAFADWEHRIGGEGGLFAQVRFGRGPFPHRVEADLGDTTIEMAVGYRRAVPGGGEMDFALLENLLPATNSPDVGAWIGYRWRPATERAP
jgi:hypothetical protein